MCGIVGFHRINRPPEQFGRLLVGMLACIQYRGPDEFGYYFDDAVGLGTARLSIIDLAHGTQPMSDPTRRYWISFNGEIYNYLELRAELESCGVPFVTQSDTEVLLRALVRWGTSALNRLDGQFAFAFYDAKQRILTLARDPFGERPLFYAAGAGGIFFASEIKALFHVSDIERRISSESLSMPYYAWTTVPGETCFRDVKEIPRGHHMEIGTTGSRLLRYHQIRWRHLPQPRTMNDAVEMTRQVLTTSVRRRLRADTTVATYLSGGLNSAIITAIARSQTCGELRSYSLRFVESEYDETQWQHDAQSYFETVHHETLVSARDIVDNFQRTIWHAEAVLFRTAAVPMLLLGQSVHRDGIKVVLSGEGADEAFLGYDLFKEVMLRKQWLSFPDDEARASALRQLYHYLPIFGAQSARSMLGFYNRFLDGQEPALFSHEMRLANGSFTLRLLSDPIAESSLREVLIDLVRERADQSSDALAAAQLLEYDTLLAGYLLSSQGDRMTAANSIEGRCPFLSTDVVDVANSLSIEQRLGDGFDEKLVLKRAFAEVLPSNIVSRPKQPYRAPGASCFLGSDSPDWLDDLLDQRSIAEAGLHDTNYAARLVSKIRQTETTSLSAREDQSFILLLSTLLLWRMFIKAPRPMGPELGEKLVRIVDGRN